ncbi:MAG: hypothetical protein U0905_17470 [Pirellulales bacterium]
MSSFQMNPAHLLPRHALAQLLAWSRAIVVGTICLSSASFAQDRLYPLQGAAVNGTVEEMAPDKVVMQVRGNNQNFPSNTIGWIVYEGDPPTFTRAKEFVSKGQYEEAMIEIRKVDASAIKSDTSKKELEFYQSYIEGKQALQGKGDAAKAIKGLLAFVSANKETYHFYDCSELLGELAVQVGSYDNASKYFGAMAKAPFKETAFRSRFLQAKALFAQGKFGEAKKAAADVISGQASDAPAIRLQKLAAVLQARCDASEGNADAALMSLNKLIQENDSSDAELFSKIYNAQGEILFKLDRAEEAAIAFLHTDLLFANQPESHAEALYYLAQIWKKLGDALRADEAREKLTTSYAGTPWAKK